MDSSLGTFLSRPVKIYQFDWNVGIPVEEIINPWNLFIQDVTNILKVSRFRAIRGNLNLKIQIAGSPFFSGRLMASYFPLEYFDAQKTDITTTTTKLIRESQRITAYIDPTLSEGCEIVCPFYWFYNAVDMLTGEYNLLGNLTIRDLAPLRSVSETSSTANVTVFAWMEDVSFVGQTYSTVQPIPPPLLTQAHMGEVDEKGPVSKVASAVQKISGALSSVPGIGPYAMATNVAAGKAGQVAKIFGYSRPTEIESAKKFVRLDAPAMAVTNETFPEYQLAVDVRNECTIDPSVAGFPQKDELDIAFLAGKESFLTSIPWGLVNGQGDILFNSGVSPMMFWNQAGLIVYTPMGYIAELFSYWRGSIDFRFEICSSAFHKGKLKLSYDSSAHPTMGLQEIGTFNTGENLVVDISEDRDFTVRVGWAQVAPYQQLAFDIRGATQRRFAVANMAPYQPTAELNGMITLTVLNPLTSPYNATMSDADIQINVYVKAAPDIQFGVPSERLADKSFGDSDPVAPVATVAHMGVDPTEVSTMTEIHTFGRPIPQDASDLIFFGESIVSLRSLIKRFENLTVDVTEVTTETWLKLWLSRFPSARGLLTPTITPWTQMTTLNWVSALFVARRGGARYILDNQTTAKVIVENVQPGTVTSLPFKTSQVIGADSFAKARNMLNFTDSGAAGQQIIGDGLSAVYLPYYSNKRFFPAKDYYNNLLEDTSFSCAYRVPENTDSYLAFAVAAAEDTTFHGFMGVPLVYRLLFL